MSKTNPNDRIIQVYEELGGNSETMLEWFQKGDLDIITKHLNEHDLSSESIVSAFKNMIEEFFIVEDDVVKGMELIPNILEATEDDPYTSLLPAKKELESVDQRVLEAMDNHWVNIPVQEIDLGDDGMAKIGLDDTILIADEDILGISNSL